MRILVLNHEYPPIGGGGGQAAESLVNELVLRGHEVTVLTAHYGNLSLKEVTNGKKIIRLPSFRKQPFRAGLLTMGVYILAAILTGLKIIRSWKPDVIHVHFAVPAGAAAWVLAHLTGIPYVLTAHLGDIPGGVPEKTGKWFRWIFPFTKPIWRGAVRIVTVSEHTSLLIKAHYLVNPVVIPNGIKLRKINPKELKDHWPPVIIFAGRFVPQKNPFGIVETLSMLQDLPWKCNLLGDGAMLNDVKLAITAQGLEERFHITGWVSPEEVLSYLAQSDILFMPSLSEGLPVIGVQALSEGLAIVASQTGGFKNLVEPGRNGFIADHLDQLALSKGLRELLINRNRLMNARRASLEIAKRFDIVVVADAYEKVFREVASKGLSHQI